MKIYSEYTRKNQILIKLSVKCIIIDDMNCFRELAMIIKYFETKRNC